MIDCEKAKEENDKEEELAVDHLKVTKPFKLPQEEQQRKSRWAIMGSSNGLICLSACRFHGLKHGFFEFAYGIYVYNPMTSEFVDVGTETHTAAGDGYRASGFGYHPTTKEYKVVRINYETIVTFGTGQSLYPWNLEVVLVDGDKGEIPYVITSVRKPGVLVNGALYWITLDRKILSFDLAEEEFRIVPKPRRLNLWKTNGLGVLRGCLCVGTTKNNGTTNLWVMNTNKLYI